MDKESFGDMTSRFYHLLTELGNFGVVTTPVEVVKKFADALPPQWNSFLEILKYNGVLATTNINDFVQLLENKDQEETLKAKKVPVHKIQRCIMEPPAPLLQGQSLMLLFRRHWSRAHIYMAIRYRFLSSQLRQQTCMEILYSQFLNSKSIGHLP
ncbi:hypothetical protein Hdeb2414_s0233g00842721 [Helianthus debilis subsp. tardiflorus]